MQQWSSIRGVGCAANDGKILRSIDATSDYVNEASEPTGVNEWVWPQKCVEDVEYHVSSSFLDRERSSFTRCFMDRLAVIS